MMTSSEQNWPKTFPELERLDNLLRCGICYDYVKTALMTPCSHNFCSICIRKYMLYKTSCPVCFIKTVDTQLINNRALDEIVGILERLKGPLCQALKENIPNDVSDILNRKSTSTPATSCKTSLNSIPPEICDTKIPSPSNLEVSNTTLYEEEGEEEEVSNSSMQLPSMRSPTTSHEPVGVSTPKHASSLPGVSSQQKVPDKAPARSVMQMLMSPIKKAGPSSAPAPSSPPPSLQPAVLHTVSCPVCDVPISQRYINLHLDACLKNSDQAPLPRPEKSSNWRKPMSKPVYHLLSDRNLKKMLGDLRLSTQGDRRTLERRHQKYTVLYNSECDSETPRPASELVKQVEREEKEEGRAGCRTLTTLQVDRKADPKVIDEAHKKYRVEHKSSFEALIAEMKRRRAKTNDVRSSSAASTSSASTSSAPSTSSSTPSTSSNSESTTQCAASTPSLQAQSPRTPNAKDSDLPPQHHISSPSLLSEVVSPPCSPVVGAQVLSPSILPHSRSPSIANSPVGINGLMDYQKTAVKSPIFGKRRLFESYETNHANNISTVIEISDDSDCTNFSDSDFAQIDALTQQNVSGADRSVSNETPAMTLPSPKPQVPESSSDSDADMFQAPKSKRPQVKQKKANKRQKPDEPRRSQRKKARN